MNTLTTPTLFFLAIGFACQSHAGDLTGKATLKGTPPPEKMVNVTNPTLATKYPQGLTTRHYQVGPDGGLQQVLVYVSGDFTIVTGKPAPHRPQTPAVLDHIDDLFQPYVLGVQVDQPVQLKCQDGTGCSFIALPNCNTAFSLTPGNETVTRTFTKSEPPIRFKCDAHPWNYAYVGVFDHPHFAVTDQAGTFSIPGLPPGRYTVEIFHPKTGKSSQTVDVGGKTTTVQFEVTPT